MTSNDAQARRRGALPKRRTPGVESPRKVLQLLLGYSDRRPTASIQELADEVEVPISTAYRYVSLLKELGLLEETDGARYRVAPRIMGVARAAQAANSLASLARPIMRALSVEINESIMLVRMIAGSAVCVEHVESSRPVRLSVQPGQPLPLHVGASGKSLLACRPAADREAFLQAQAELDPVFAQRLDGFRDELDRIAARGWAVSRGEIDEGIWACSAAITHEGRALGTLTVAGPAYRIDEAEQRRILAHLRDAASELAAEVAKRPEAV